MEIKALRIASLSITESGKLLGISKNFNKIRIEIYWDSGMSGIAHLNSSQITLQQGCLQSLIETIERIELILVLLQPDFCFRALILLIYLVDLA